MVGLSLGTISEALQVCRQNFDSRCVLESLVLLFTRWLTSPASKKQSPAAGSSEIGPAIIVPFLSKKGFWIAVQGDGFTEPLEKDKESQVRRFWSVEVAKTQ